MTPDPAPPPAGPDLDSLSEGEMDQLVIGSELALQTRPGALVPGYILRAVAELRRLRAERGRLADALRPFAERHEEYADSADDWPFADDLTVGDLRRAAAALEESP